MRLSDGRRIAHPDWVQDASRSIASHVKLYSSGKLPPQIEVFMVVTPVRRLLRGVYGSDLKAALVLLHAAIGNINRQFWWAIWRFWQYRVLMRSPDKELNDLLEGSEEDA